MTWRGDPPSDRELPVGDDLFLEPLGPEARALLQAARGGDDPSPGDRARLRGSVRAAIVLAGAAPAAGAAAAPGAGSAAPGVAANAGAAGGAGARTAASGSAATPVGAAGGEGATTAATGSAPSAGCPGVSSAGSGATATAGGQAGALGGGVPTAGVLGGSLLSSGLAPKVMAVVLIGGAVLGGGAVLLRRGDAPPGEEAATVGDVRAATDVATKRGAAEGRTVPSLHAPERGGAGGDGLVDGDSSEVTGGRDTPSGGGPAARIGQAPRRLEAPKRPGASTSQGGPAPARRDRGEPWASSADRDRASDGEVAPRDREPPAPARSAEPAGPSLGADEGAPPPDTARSAEEAPRSAPDGRRDDDDDDDTLRQESQALHRARAALVAGRPGDALAILNALEARVPVGQLGPERAYHRVLALCGLGRADEAARVGRRLAASFAPYAGRLEATCIEEPLRER